MDKLCGATITNQTLFNEVTKSQLKRATLKDLSELCDMLSLELWYRADHGDMPAHVNRAAQGASISALDLRNAQRAIDDAKEGK